MTRENTHDVEALGSDGATPAGSPVVNPDTSTELPPPTAHPDPDARVAAEQDHVERQYSDTTDPDAPVLVGVAFEKRLLAQEYLMAMARLRSEGSLTLKDAVIVEKTLDGHVKVTETIDPTPGRSALSGAMWTGLLGLVVGGPVGWIAGIGIGAGAGAVTAKVIDLGIPDEWVDWFKQAVRPGTSAVVILAENLDMRALQREAERFPGAEVVESTLPEAVFHELA
ncbi:MAG: DUF1269 domain-containing protein, partial [Ilumatobacter sp.]